MKAFVVSPSAISKIGSILISTTLVIGFALVQAPLRNVGARDSAGVVVRPAVQDVHPKNQLQLTVGKSLIVDSAAQIVRAEVGNPALADAIAIDAHELLVNGKLVGATTLTLWQEGGASKKFELNVKAGSHDASHIPSEDTVGHLGISGKILMAFSSSGVGK